MGIEVPDMLRTIDRKPAVSSGPRESAAADGSPRRMGESFAQFLNRTMVGRNSGSGLAGATSGSTASTLNGSLLPADDAATDAPKSGESLTTFLNRRRLPETGGMSGQSINAARTNNSSAAGSTKSAAKTAGATAGSTGGASLNQMKLAGSEEDPEVARHAQAEKAAEGLVSNALILPILKQLRRSPFGENSVFSGGIGEKTFGPEFDMQLADRIAQSPRLPVKEALVKRLEARGRAIAGNGQQGAKASTRLDVNG